MPNWVPDFGQFVEYVTEGNVFHHVELSQHSLDVLPVLETVQADYTKVATIGRQLVLTADELLALQVDAASVYHPDVIENEITSTDPLVIVGNLIEVRSRPDWIAWIAVAIGDVYFYSGNLYQVIQAHTTQPDWTPDITPALWKRFYEANVIPEWVQPAGAHDAYALGAQVTHVGHLWESLYAANVWEPGVFGWSDLGVYP